MCQNGRDLKKMTKIKKWAILYRIVTLEMWLAFAVCSSFFDVIAAIYNLRASFSTATRSDTEMGPPLLRFSAVKHTKPASFPFPTSAGAQYLCLILTRLLDDLNRRISLYFVLE